MKKPKTIYYESELTDEFSTAQITAKKIDADYCYCHDSLFKKFTHIFWYRIIFTPLAYFYTKLAFSHKTVGKEKFKEIKRTGYFMYGNHTQDIGDAFIPNMINLPQDNYVIVHPNNVSMPFLGRITPSLGALPLPDDLTAYRNFTKAVDRRIREGHTVVIYPEAHIWPYYTGIRPFSDDSFCYPVKLGVPAFCFTNTYQKRKFLKKPRIVTYIDGPFYPDKTLPAKEQRRELHDRIYAQMCERAKSSTVVYVQYIKKEKTND